MTVLSHNAQPFLRFSAGPRWPCEMLSLIHLLERTQNWVEFGDNIRRYNLVSPF